MISSKIPACGGANPFVNNTTLLPHRLTTKHAMLIWFGNVTINTTMKKQNTKPKNKLTEKNIDTWINAIFAQVLGDDWQEGSRKAKGRGAD